ncbi:hypothetical protein V6N11_037493 [Hibiscus sabdariffa]|uniref:t-SNARE coiled-coil homology domain-containing protein n=1 Tax=Hibiscus sabdariffa TaxID=183260 RepID=A0ABR2P1Y9_9ROSI
MNPRRDMRNGRVALFDGIEEGGIRASSSYSHEIDEHENERAMEGLQDRVNLLKRLSGDIHEEVDSHNRMLDRMGNDMDASRGILSGTMDKFKMVFETKSSRRMFTLVASFVHIVSSSTNHARVPFKSFKVFGLNNGRHSHLSSIIFISHLERNVSSISIGPDSMGHACVRKTYGSSFAASRKARKMAYFSPSLNSHFPDSFRVPRFHRYIDLKTGVWEH